jgi:hypothetical protein
VKKMYLVWILLVPFFRPENTSKHVFRGRGEDAKYYHAGMLCNHKFLCVIASHIKVLHYVGIKNGSSLELYIQI